MEHTKYPTIRTNWYIQQTHVGATNRKASKNNKNYHVLQNQLPLLLTRNTTAKDLYKTTCTHGAHKLHNCKNKVVHTANPFRVYRRVPCPRVQMRPLTACTDEAPSRLRPFSLWVHLLFAVEKLTFWTSKVWYIFSKTHNLSQWSSQGGVLGRLFTCKSGGNIFQRRDLGNWNDTRSSTPQKSYTSKG